MMHQNLPSIVHGLRPILAPPVYQKPSMQLLHHCTQYIVHYIPTLRNNQLMMHQNLPSTKDQNKESDAHWYAKR